VTAIDYRFPSHSRWVFRSSLAVLLVLTSVTVWIVALAEGAQPAGADPIAECSTTVGEIVAVDFSHWGGPIARGCDAKLTTGYNALYEAGFISQGTQEDGPGFICRIGLSSEGPSSYEPSTSEDSCVDTPPPTAYWSYWHADPGQNTWTYSEQGAMDYQPSPGSVDAWVFGATNLSGTTGRPSFPPSAVRATNTSPSSPTSTVPSSTVPTHTSQPGPTSTSRPLPTSTTTAVTSKPAGGATGNQAPPKDSSPTNHSTTMTTTTEVASKGGARSDPPPTNPSRASASDHHLPKIVTIGPASATGALPPPGNSALSFEIGASVVAVVAVAGGIVALRRRHNGGLQ
jgi:hypothetical protein